MNAANPSDFIVIPDATAERAAGAIVWWRLSGPVNAVKLAQSWAVVGLDVDLLPSPASPQRALGRAFKGATTKHRMRRAVQRTHLLVDEQVDREENDPAYAVAARGRVADDGRLVLAATDPDVAAGIRTRFDEHLGLLSPNDISGWLARDVMRNLKAVGLRDTGGVYFVPQPSMGRWRMTCQALANVSQHVLHEVPAMRTTEAVAAILDAVSREAEADAESIQAELDNGALGSRALQTRRARCEEMSAKLTTYETLLGRKLDDLRARVEALDAGVAAATLSAMAAEEIDRE